MSQVLPSISKVIAARCQMGSRPLAGTARHVHSSDVLKRCLQFPLLHRLPGAGGSPQLHCVHALPSAPASRCLPLRAFQSQRLVADCPCWDRAGCVEDPQPARASGQHPRSAQLPLCSESAVTLPAEKSFFVGRFSFPVPLLAVFCLPLACHCLLLPAWPGAGLHFIFPSTNRHVAP